MSIYRIGAYMGGKLVAWLHHFELTPGAERLESDPSLAIYGARLRLNGARPDAVGDNAIGILVFTSHALADLVAKCAMGLNPALDLRVSPFTPSVGIELPSEVT